MNNINSDKKNDRICIIAVGYNRPASMCRLLKSLKDAYYDETVDLLISIDKGERQSAIVEIAETFEWLFGEKHIRVFNEKQGLRNHILQCGDITQYYKAVIILEDDITVAPGFFSYVKQCVSEYETDNHIAGISLYTNIVLQTGYYFFEPEFCGDDVFFMQYAQSWGQCWTKKMWQEFKSWYNENKDSYFSPENTGLVKIPDNVINWDGHSWLKYFIAYTVEANKYFVYPYHSLTTNHSETGQHCNYVNSDYMVSLQGGTMSYRLPDFADSVKYDVFFERVGMTVPKYEDKRVVLDLYGNKKDLVGADVLISSAAHPYRVIESWRLKYRPQENNCIHQEQGNGIYVYDLHTSARPPKPVDVKIRARYDTRSLSWKNLLRLGIEGIKEAIKSRIKR